MSATDQFDRGFALSPDRPVLADSLSGEAATSRCETATASSGSWIVDRGHDMIISGDFNVASSAVEKAFRNHPAVGECTNIRHPGRGEWRKAVTASVEPTSGVTVDAGAGARARRTAAHGDGQGPQAVPRRRILGPARTREFMTTTSIRRDRRSKDADSPARQQKGNRMEPTYTLAMIAAPATGLADAECAPDDRSSLPTISTSRRDCMRSHS